MEQTIGLILRLVSLFLTVWHLFVIVSALLHDTKEPKLDQNWSQSNNTVDANQTSRTDISENEKKENQRKHTTKLEDLIVN